LEESVSLSRCGAAQGSRLGAAAPTAPWLRHCIAETIYKHSISL